MSSPIIFALPGYAQLLPADVTSGSSPALGSCAFERFANGELCVRVAEQVEGRVCGVLGSLAPPDEQMLCVLLLGHTLRRLGARRVLALLPYLGYARQDRAEPGQSLGAGWAGELMRACGFERVLTVDVHSRLDEACFAIAIDSLSPARLFAAVLAQRGLADVTVVAPDEGAVERCQAVIDAAALPAPLVRLSKRRDASGVRHTALQGEIGAQVAVVDDILDTGGTLVSACEELRRAGAAQITVFATHGLFTGERWRELGELGVERIYTTDSLPGAGARGGALVEELSATGLVLDAFAALASSG